MLNVTSLKVNEGSDVSKRGEQNQSATPIPVQGEPREVDSRAVNKLIPFLSSESPVSSLMVTAFAKSPSSPVPNR